ncbi:hypothetical protein [Bacillus thuringiensis]
MSREGIRKMLHRMNFSYTNATYVLKKKCSFKNH